MTPTGVALAFTSPPQTVRAGACSAPLTVELRDGANAPVAATVAVPLTILSGPMPGVTLYSDAMCMTPLAALVIAVGATSVSFYATSATGLTYQVTATSGTLSAGSITHDVLPVVRRGTCTLASNATMQGCPIVPAVLQTADSFLVYQVTSSSGDPSAAVVRCVLTSTSLLTCTRSDSGGVANVYWQVAEVRGATVTRLATTCSGTTFAIPMVNPAEAFVLEALETSGAGLDESDQHQVRVTSPTQVTVTHGSGCDSQMAMAIQVVVLPGLQVVRDTTTLPAGSTTITAGGLPSVTDSVVLSTYRVPTGLSGTVCPLFAEVQVAGPTSLTFTRGNGSNDSQCSVMNLEVAYERLATGAIASQTRQARLTFAPDAGTASAMVPAGLDRTRTLLFSGNQGPGGQSLGQTSFHGASPNDILGEVSVGFTLPGTGYQTVQINGARDSVRGPTSVTVFAVELLP